jgi:hypothetical protein
MLYLPTKGILKTQRPQTKSTLGCNVNLFLYYNKQKSSYSVLIDEQLKRKKCQKILIMN